jgi:hypothetical protein
MTRHGLLRVTEQIDYMTLRALNVSRERPPAECNSISTVYAQTSAFLPYLRGSQFMYGVWRLADDVWH